MQKTRIIILALCLVIVASSVSSYAYARGYLDFLLYEQKTRSWNINMGTTHVREPRTTRITAESRDKKNERIVYSIVIYGPKGFSNRDLVLSWNDSDGHCHKIGRGCNESFKGTTVLRWRSTAVLFKAKQKTDITMVLTFLETARLGKYRGEIWISEI